MRTHFGLFEKQEVSLAKCLAVLKKQHVFNSAGVRKSSAQYSLDRGYCCVAKPRGKATAVSFEELKKKKSKKS